MITKYFQSIKNIKTTIPATAFQNSWHLQQSISLVTHPAWIRLHDD